MPASLREGCIGIKALLRYLRPGISTEIQCEETERTEVFPGIPISEQDGRQDLSPLQHFCDISLSYFFAGLDSMKERILRER